MVQKKDEVVIYWSPLTVPAPKLQTHVNLLWGPPVPVLPLLEQGAYRKCTAANDSLKNTYTFLHPKDVVITYDVNTKQFSSDFDGWYVRPDEPVEGRPGIEYDFHWTFFCEEPMLMKLTPPYLHNTSDRATTTIASGQFDISKWFRAINPSYIFWKGCNSIQLTKGEPIFYLEFFTDKKIILKQFEMNERLQYAALETAALSKVFPYEPLKMKYYRFIRGNRHKSVLKLIKENLLE